MISHKFITRAGFDHYNSMCNGLDIIKGKAFEKYIIKNMNDGDINYHIQRIISIKKLIANLININRLEGGRPPKERIIRIRNLNKTLSIHKAIIKNKI